MTGSARDLPGRDYASTARIRRVAAPLRAQVSSVLRQAIIARDLRPGQRLVERELVDWLRVSRATVRESLHELAAEGLVTVIPQRGAVVASISEREAADVYEARAAIESLLVRHFVERASDAQVGQLADALDELREATRAGRPICEILDVRSRFFGIVTDGAGSLVLTAMLSSLQARMSVLGASSQGRPVPPTEMVRELQALAAAIGARDAGAAEQLSAGHVRNAAPTGKGRRAGGSPATMA